MPKSKQVRLKHVNGFLIINADYLRALARKLTRDADLLEDLQQEGAIALLNAACNYDAARGAQFLTYATPIVRASMLSFMARMSIPMAVPPTRYNQLRRAGYIVARASKVDIIREICQSLRVSEKVARELLGECYRNYLSDEDVELDMVPAGFEADPANIYDQRLLFLNIEGALNALPVRERNLIQYHLGLSQPNGKGMTFQELEIRLNFNNHSAAEKAYNRAIETLRDKLHTTARTK